MIELVKYLKSEAGIKSPNEEDLCFKVLSGDAPG